jgi:hypothetical protein
VKYNFLTFPPKSVIHLVHAEGDKKENILSDRTMEVTVLFLTIKSLTSNEIRPILLLLLL